MSAKRMDYVVTTVHRDSSPEEIRAWLIERVAYYLELPTQKIDPELELAEYGMDSVYTMSIVAEIEDHLGVKIDEMAAWKYSTINALVEYAENLISEQVHSAR
ncbi:acyl carrier protein [Streptomyces sp. NPDC057403]|uniref:acyl carrier protein n=1 Tax=Streptomyces sp. NPDC057403 TaxID=3346119 RepID=UPI00368226CB